MSWGISAKARRFAIDGEVARAFRSARSQTATEPAGLRTVGVHERTVGEIIQQAPHDCDITVSSYGHFDADGIGSAKLEVTIARHQKPFDLPPLAAEEEMPAPIVEDETPVAAPDA